VQRSEEQERLSVRFQDVEEPIQSQFGLVEALRRVRGYVDPLRAADE
jgi:hypothetical protein